MPSQSLVPVMCTQWEFKKDMLNNFKECKSAEIHMPRGKNSYTHLEEVHSTVKKLK